MAIDECADSRSGSGCRPRRHHVAAGAVQALRESGLSVPADISVVGFNNDPFAADLQLTTVHIPARELGRTAAEFAVAPTPTSSHTMLGTHVVVRETVRSVALTSPRS